MDQSLTSDAVRAELKRILASTEFNTSKRCQDFLEFVVNRTLVGSSEELKERTIGIEVFGRSPDYHTGTDGIVRINASAVRRRLAIYYADSGRYSDCRITLPTGCYVPVFSKPAKAPTDAIAESSPSCLPQFSFSTPVAVNHPSSTPAPTPLPSPKFPRRAWLVTFAAVLAATILFARWIETRPSQTIVNTFWQPMFQGKTPIMIVPAYVPAYSSTADTPDGRFTLMTDQYVGGGDLVAAVQISSMLVRLGHPFNLRLGSDVSLNDLHRTPTVLIGYSSTQWKDLTKKFRFFVDDSSGMIQDNGKPTGWYPHHETPEQHTEEDYAVISRAFDPETGAMLILVSGCMQYGTEGAAQLITNPEQLASAMRNAPHDWQKKNLQLVVQFDVVDNTPASSRVVASYYW